jgi:hypothetical protein
MQVRFEMSGGYAGAFAARPLTCVVNGDELPEPQRRWVQQMVDEPGPPPRAPGDPDPPRGGDVMTYRLTITAGGESRHFRFDDMTAPPGVRPLLQYLQQRAITDRAAQR